MVSPAVLLVTSWLRPESWKKYSQAAELEPLPPVGGSAVQPFWPLSQ